LPRKRNHSGRPDRGNPGKVEERGKIREESVIIRVGDEGVVEKVSVTTYKNKKTVIVKLRTMRIPEEGDKFAPRNAQKGTIGLVMSDIDLPFSVSSGISPDFIMNTHSLPSRMTMAYPMEIQSSKAASMSGVRINGGAFNKNNLDEHRKILKRYYLETSSEFGMMQLQLPIP
jgi:DNA-directed RNA polymerase beta subunit